MIGMSDESFFLNKFNHDIFWRFKELNLLKN